MTWNHRVMKHEEDGVTLYTIREVFYEDDGGISWTAEPIHPQGETLGELQSEVEMMLTAFTRSVLDEGELEKEYGG